MSYLDVTSIHRARAAEEKAEYALVRQEAAEDLVGVHLEGMRGDIQTIREAVKELQERGSGSGALSIWIVGIILGLMLARGFHWI